MAEAKKTPHDTAPMAGRCACGHVRYEMLGPPMIVHACHCSWCQRESGAAFALNAMIEAGRVTLAAGETETIDTPTHSGKGQKVVRCPTCKVALWSHYAGAGPAACFVRVGTLEEPGRVPPDIHIFTSTKLPWLPLPPGAKAVPEYYNPKEVWPAPSVQRWKAMMGKA